MSDQGTFLIDLSRPPGRALFATAINAVLDQFDPAAVQYDGFEKLQLIAGQDFGHSSKTFSSGLWRGNPTPDWYHYVSTQAIVLGSIKRRNALDQSSAGTSF